MQQVKIIKLTVAVIYIALFSNSAFAKPQLKLDSIVTQPGSNSNLTLSLQAGDGPYTGFNAKITMPEGITITGLSAGDLLDSSFHIEYHTSAEADTNYVNILAYSETSAFTNSGSLLNLSLSVSTETLPGDHAISFATVDIGVPNAAHALSSADGSISVDHSIRNGTITVLAASSPDTDAVGKWESGDTHDAHDSGGGVEVTARER